ncbi:MAG: right-handed parallel beta-helix repeat-containing protein, partial [Chitinophagaceae bacterium]
MRKVLVLLTGLLASAAAFATPLSGTYTINNSQVASASNFRNFVSAVAYLTGVGSRTDGGPANSAPFGVSGPVVFQVNAGTYTENISIGAVAGSSSSNTITFQSASGTASGTSLVSPGTPAAFIVTLNGTSYISFRNLTFLGASSNNFRGALSLTSCRSFAASGCAFTVPNNSSSGTAYIGTTSSRGLTIENSSFSGFLRHINSLSDSGVLIRNNTFTGNGSSNDNIHTEGMSSGRISANVFTSTNANAVYVGNAPTFIDTIWITGNRFISHRGQWSVTIQNEYAPADKPVIVANNFFGDVAREPVYLYYTSNIQLLHNSFYAPAANANVRLITFIESSQATVRNNIFQLKGNAAGSGAQIYYFPYSFPIVTPLNNVYYSLDTAQYADLRNRDAGARFEEVGFTSANDLHIINGCLQAPTIAWIADDIDGDARGAVNANYGADEVTGVANDAGFLRVTAPAPQVVSAGTVLQFAAKVRNYGTSTISSLQAGYQVNGGATVTETFNGISIAPCDSALITFTTTHTVNSEVTAVQVFPMLTNGAAETRTAIDTASATYYTAMSGTYTINAAGSGTRNFRRFAEADSALISRGVSAAVQFDMYPGNYAGDTLRSVAGLSAANPVLFRSYTGDTASVVFNARAVVVAEGAGFYTFRGLKFAILSSTNNLLLQRNTHDITIENCSFVTTAYPVCGFGCSAEPSWAINVINADSAIVIRNNKVVGMVNVTAGREQNGRVAVNTRGVLIKGNRIGAGRGFIYTSYTLYSIKADSL